MSPPLEVREAKRDGEHSDRGGADRRSDDDVVEVEADLNRDVDHEHVHAERRDLTDEGRAECGHAQLQLGKRPAGGPRVRDVARERDRGRRGDDGPYPVAEPEKREGQRAVQ
jgi:hypothetical protein